jgi:hypothetical protein
MDRARVWVECEPFIFGDVMSRLFSTLDKVEVVNYFSEDVDVIVISANASGAPHIASLPEYLAKIKCIVISPAGDCGWIRLPGENRWHKSQPVNLYELCSEVCAGRKRPESRLDNPILRRPSGFSM